MTTTVAVLGTGVMGTAMAHALADAGLELRVWNRTAERAAALRDCGASVAGTPREACQGADVVLTMLLDTDAVFAAMDGPDGGFAGMSDDAVWLQTSTVGVAGEARLRELAEAAGASYLDCPVLGTVAPAESGNLVMLASGNEELRSRVEPVLDALGQRTIWVGAAGAASRLKLVANSWVLAVTTAVGEAMALAGALDLDPALFLSVIEGGALDLPYAHLKGDLILDEKFPASFTVSGAAKDADLIVAAGEDSGVRLEVADAVRRQMERTRDDGHADEDMAAVWYAARG
jgi:3-hydroxyisobutyrate dehydrogenase